MAPLRQGWSRAAAVRTAGLRLPHAGPAVPAPQNPSTSKHRKPRLPAPPPPPALQPPRPHAAPREQGSGGAAAPSRPGPAALLPAARRPGARQEAAPVSWHLSASDPLPTSHGWGGGGAGVPSSSRSSAAGRVGREATPRGCRGWGCPRLGPGLTGRDRWGCALAPSGVAAEGGTGGIRSLHGNSCTDSGGWAAARGGETREASSEGGGEGRGEGQGARTRARAHSLSPAPPPPSSALLLSPSRGSSLSPALRACPEPRSRPPGACSASERNLGRVHALPGGGSAPAQRRPRPLPQGLAGASLGRVGTAAWATWAKGQWGLCPLSTAGEGQFHV